VFANSREPTVLARFGQASLILSEALIVRWTLSILGNNLDIEEFIDTELEARILEAGKLSISNPAIILEIQHALSS